MQLTINAKNIEHYDVDEIRSSRVQWRDEEYTVKRVYDDSWGQWWLVGGLRGQSERPSEEYGPSMLIRCDGGQSAYEIYVDESKPIDIDDIPDAYGIIDWLRDEFTSFDWHDGNADFDTTNLVSKLLIGIYFKDQRNIYFDSVDWQEVLRNELPYLAEIQNRQLADGLANLPEHGWDLAEGYEYQSNATDTGIVNVGHHLWIEEIDPSDIELGIDGEELEECEQ